MEYTYYLADNFLVTSISDCIILEHPLNACCVLNMRIISSVISVLDFSKKPAWSLPNVPSLGAAKVGTPLSPVSWNLAVPIFCNPNSLTKSARAILPTIFLIIINL